MTKRLMRKWMTVAVIGGLTSAMLTGCAWSVGGEKGDTVLRPTRGQELLDLKRALDQGAMTEAEYQAQKKRVMDR